jgi:hypothetical protein
MRMRTSILDWTIPRSKTGPPHPLWSDADGEATILRHTDALEGFQMEVRYG